ncbi:MAG: Glycosyl transferase, group 1 [uncultured Sulfurovum sp.]|uniref:Glycosyl transferase, group 1 n=1 Tax=uncultured Sulfurovum sp. TaxID=269237 RepID=A0A6S6TM51_9BACT|nr:MAG: Glycosyl transferase, group 1 [uncultured Sulfurovum sp.]
MKILFLTDNFPPEVNAPATRTFEHCKYWIDLGHEVTVITCAPNFPQGKVYTGYKNKFYSKEKVNGITVVRVWSYIAENKGFTKRSLDHLSFAFSSFFTALFLGKFDYIIATSPQFFTSWSGYLLSKFKRTPWLFEVRDMWPEGIIFLNKESKIYKVLEKIELALYRDASKIVTVTESFKKSIIKRADVPAEKIETIYNGSNNNLFQAREKNQKILKELKLENKFIIGYAGTLGISHSLEFIVNQLTLVKEKDIHFLFIGDGAVKKNMLILIKELNLTNITMVDAVKKEDMPSYLSIFDIGLVSLKKEDAYLKVIPSKIFELASMQKPILLGVDGEVRKIVSSYNAGEYFEAENSEEFLNKVSYFYQNRDLLSSYTEGLSKLSNDFDREALAERMIDFIRNTK